MISTKRVSAILKRIERIDASGRFDYDGIGGSLGSVGVGITIGNSSGDGGFTIANDGYFACGGVDFSYRFFIG